jgi:hypothetical protein
VAEARDGSDESRPAAGAAVVAEVRSAIERLDLADVIAVSYVDERRVVRLHLVGGGAVLEYALDSALLGRIDEHLEGLARRRRREPAG